MCVFLGSRYHGRVRNKKGTVEQIECEHACNINGSRYDILVSSYFVIHSCIHDKLKKSQNHQSLTLRKKPKCPLDLRL